MKLTKICKFRACYLFGKNRKLN